MKEGACGGVEDGMASRKGTEFLKSSEPEVAAPEVHVRHSAAAIGRPPLRPQSPAHSCPAGAGTPPLLWSWPSPPC